MFDFESLSTTLPIMGNGVLGIFIVIIVIVYSVFLLEFLFPHQIIKDYRKNKKQEKSINREKTKFR